MICPTAKAEYFLKEGWTAGSFDPLICPAGRHQAPRTAVVPRACAGFAGTTHGVAPYSSGSTLTIEAPWLLPAQKVTGVVELSTKTRRMLVLRGRR